MLKEVVKRDGKIQKFQILKIKRAIMRANDEVEEDEQATQDEVNAIANNIANSNVDKLHIETIQNLIENDIMAYRHFELARKYITYRYKQKLNRDLTATERSILDLIHGTNKDVIEENSNKNSFTASTQRDLIAGEVSKDITHRVILPVDIENAIKNRWIHWHDADYSIQNIFNCCLIDIKNIFDNGTVMNGLLIESPKSFQVACTIMTQVIANIASNQYGGQSVNLKWLAKYVAVSREKYMLKQAKSFDKAGISYTEEQLKQVTADRLAEEVSQGIQTVQYQLNTLLTTNGQSPFVTLFMHIEDGYEYEEELAMIVEEVIKQRYKGVKGQNGAYITPSFPKLIYVTDENNITKDSKYWYITELAAKCSIKRSYPDYISAKVMREQFDGEVFSPMGCRSVLSPWKRTAEYCRLCGEPEELAGTYKWEGRFNQGVVTINLPQIAIEADGNMDTFWIKLEERLSIAYKALLLRHQLLENTLTSTSPLHWQFGAIARLKEGDNINKLLHNGYSTLSLGYIGIYETVYQMLGVSNTTKEGSEFALKIMKKLNSACSQWKEQTGLGFGLYGTPAESLCYKFCEFDKQKYGEIPNVTDKGFYTNSYHVDVREHINAFDKLKFEAQFQALSSGGCISYIEVPNLEKNLKVVLKLIQYMYENIRYAEFNSKSDVCYNCGFDGEIQLNNDNEWVCPQCGNKDMKKMYVSRRTCGYLGANDWNWGKRKEIGIRVEHI